MHGQKLEKQGLDFQLAIEIETMDSLPKIQRQNLFKERLNLPL